MDDAVKMTLLETRDGVGALGYAGLGATSRGTHPSEWMSAVLRGRDGVPFEQALGTLATVATAELPKHLAKMPNSQAHFILVPAFIKGVGARLYSIDNVLDRATGDHHYRFTSHHRTSDPTSPVLRLAVSGTGGAYLHNKKDDAWIRMLRRLVKANDRGKISDLHVADELAKLNYECHQKVSDGTVGPRCVVAWRRRPEAMKRRSGGGHQFYTGLNRDTENPALPSVSNGMDLQAFAAMLFDRFTQAMVQKGTVGHAMQSMFEDVDDLNQKIANLPSTPDDRLR